MPAETQKRVKPSKPSKDFPLTPHATKRWCKKIRGRMYYFGTWENPEAALREYLSIREDLQGGVDPRQGGHAGGVVQTLYILNRFIERSEQRVASKDLSPVTLADYMAVGKVVLKHLGRTSDPSKLRPADFSAFRAEVASQYSPARLTKIVTVTRLIFKWAYDSEILETMPRFGPDFGVAARKSERLQKARLGKKLLTLTEVQSLLNCADAKWKAILLLCLNGGLGNSDIARIHLNDGGGEWLNLERGKTGIGRHIPLWPETRTAIQAAIAERHNPKGLDLLFLSKHGGPLIAVRESGTHTDLLSEGFNRLAKLAGIYRPRMGLYWCRHTFQTIADEAGDPVATSSIMGHADGSMAAVYRETISEDRLLKVTNHVRDWIRSSSSLDAASSGECGLP